MHVSNFAKLLLIWIVFSIPALVHGQSTASPPKQQEKQQQETKQQEKQQQESSKATAEGTTRQADGEQKVADEASEAKVVEWTRFELADTPASVLMPGQPTKTTRTVESVLDKPSVSVTAFRKTISDGKAMVSISFTPLHETMVDIKQRRETLKWAERNSIAAVLAGAALTSKEVRRQRNLGREFTFEFTHERPKTKTVVNWKCHSAIYVVGQQFFELSVIQRADSYDEALASKFLDSLEFAKQ